MEVEIPDNWTWSPMTTDRLPRWEQGSSWEDVLAVAATIAILPAGMIGAAIVAESRAGGYRVIYTTDREQHDDVVSALLARRSPLIKNTGWKFIEAPGGKATTFVTAEGALAYLATMFSPGASVRATINPKLGMIPSKAAGDRYDFQDLFG